MPIEELRTLAGKLKDIVRTVKEKKIDLDETTKKTKLLNYKMQKAIYYRKQLDSTIKKLKDNSRKISGLINYDKRNAPKLSNIISLVSELDIKDMKLLEDHAKKIEMLSYDLKVPKKRPITIPKKIPEDIKPEIVEDLKEMDRCFRSGCYRSVVILCGRLIEVALHRKYYDTTGNDILEKNPGIGLGKLIAKLKEKEISFDPGITQQIHLINQVRVSSVHKKQETFYPSKNQAQAMMLYTADVLNKLF